MLRVFTVSAVLGLAALLLMSLGTAASPLWSPARPRPRAAPAPRRRLRRTGVWGAWALGSLAVFFGLSGALAAWLDVPASLQLTFALLSALLLGGLTTAALWRADAIGASLVGRTGRVLHSASPGQVLLTLDSEEALPAQSADALAPGDRVLIVAELGGLIDVRRWDRS